MKKLHTSPNFALWQCYQDIKIRFQNRASLAVSQKLGDEYLIITACNPKSFPLSDQQNRLQTQKMRRYLKTKQIKFCEIHVGNVDFSWSEHSFAMKLSLNRGVNLARIYRQNAIYCVRNGTLWLLPVLLNEYKSENLGPVEDFS